MEFKISSEFIAQIEQLIVDNNAQELENLLQDVHFADIAEILDELDDYGASYVFKGTGFRKNS